MKEVWKPIKGYEGLYEISSLGRVKSFVGWNGKRYINRERILSPYKHHAGSGYYRRVVKLMKNGSRKDFKVHRLVAQAFIPNPNNYPVINHIDGDSLNNNVDNLEWCTQKYNISHALEIGLRKTYRPSKEELIDLYVNKRMSLKQISAEKHSTMKTVKRYINEYGIKFRSLSEADTKYFITKEFLEKELKNKTQTQLAKEIGCTQSLISKYKKEFNL